MVALAALSLLTVSSPALADPVVQDAHANVEAPPPHHRLWQPEPHTDAGSAAETAATDALLGGQLAQDRRAILRQTYLGRPPTWIQDAATVNLAEFPSLADPTEAAERELDILESVVGERAPERARAPRQDDADGGALPDGVVFGDEDVPDWLRPLLPSEWVPIVREHGETIIAGGLALLLTAWLGNLLIERIQARARRRRGRHRRWRRHRRPSSELALQAAVPLPPGDAEPAEVRTRRSGRRRRRRHTSAARVPDGASGRSTPGTKARA